MKAKVLETSVTFEFKGENTESLLLGLRNELSAKEHFDAYSLDDTITVSSDLYSEDGIAAEVYLFCGGKIDFLFNVNPGYHVVNVDRSGVKFGFFGYRDNDFADEVRSLVGDRLFVSASSDGNEIFVSSEEINCKDLTTWVDHCARKISTRLEWIKQ